jgi:hypothetical protein
MNSAQLLMAKSFIELPRLHQVTTQVQVVADQSEYDLLTQAPDLSNIIGIMCVRNDGLLSSATDPGLRMYRWPFGDYRAQSQQATSRPVRWTRHGNLFVVDPKPNDTYVLRIDYRRRPQFETVEFDSEWHEPWINCTVYLGWAALNQYNLAQAAMAMLPIWLQMQIQTPIQEEEWESYWDKAGLKASGGGFHP